MKRWLLKKEPLGYWLIYGPFILITAIAILLTTKPQLFLSLNSYYSPFFDTFFKLATYLGNGAIFVIVIIALLFYKFSDGLLGLICFLFSALIPQFIKKVLYPDSLRPYGYFKQEGIEIHLVEGVKQHTMHSFPSGHSASVFALTLLLAFVINDKKWSMVLCFIAIITAYSRIYLSHHYPEDVLTGSIIGCACTLITYLLFYNKLNSIPALQKGIIRFKK